MIGEGGSKGKEGRKRVKEERMCERESKRGSEV